MITIMLNMDETGKKSSVRQEIRLDEKILNYIRLHREGVVISEMEKPLGENRMRLGYVVNKLLEEGAILKLHNTFYPADEKTD